MSTWQQIVKEIIEALQAPQPGTPWLSAMDTFIRYVLPTVIGASAAIWVSVFVHIHTRAKEKRERRLAAIERAQEFFYEEIEAWIKVRVPLPNTSFLTSDTDYLELMLRNPNRLKWRSVTVQLKTLHLKQSAAVLDELARWRSEGWRIFQSGEPGFLVELAAHVDRFSDLGGHIIASLQHEYANVEDAGIFTAFRARTYEQDNPKK